MPLSGFNSCCQKYAQRITSRDARGRQTHVGINQKTEHVTHYHIDGVVITDGNRCDFLLINEDSHKAYLIELKGHDLSWAAMQLAETQKRLASQLSGYTVYYRIIANKCNTHEIESASFKKYRMLWKNSLKYQSVFLEEII